MRSMKIVRSGTGRSPHSAPIRSAAATERDGVGTAVRAGVSQGCWGRRLAGEIMRKKS